MTELLIQADTNQDGNADERELLDFLKEENLKTIGEECNNL